MQAKTPPTVHSLDNELRATQNEFYTDRDLLQADIDSTRGALLTLAESMGFDVDKFCKEHRWV
jgi:hypothetical protein